jgi:hypothetical protein
MEEYFFIKKLLDSGQTHIGGKILAKVEYLANYPQHIPNLPVNPVKSILVNVLELAVVTALKKELTALEKGRQQGVDSTQKGHK